MKKDTFQSDIVIIGAGLTGLCLSHFLKDTPMKIHLLEARARPGGRIYTLRPQGGPPLEMGATWFGAKHTRLATLLAKLGIESFPQRLGRHAIYEWISTSPHQLVNLPANQEPSYRIRGGTGTLIDALATGLGPGELFLEEAVREIVETPSGLQVRTESNVFETRRVVSTLPPNLLLTSVRIKPGLPEGVAGVLSKTHTWMGESIAFGLTFKEPFWRSADSSGTVFSNVGPVSEMYDHSSWEDRGFALRGFLDSSFHGLSQAARKERILSQLKKYYGKAVASYSGYSEQVWARESFTYAPYRQAVLPHQNNGHPLYQKSYLGGKLLIAGSETAGAFPGYMEGAVRSAEWAGNLLLKNPEPA